MTTTLPRLRTPLVATAIMTSLLCALPAVAQPPSSERSTRVHSIRRLGGTTRMTPPVRTVDQLTRAFASPRTRNDIAAVLSAAGMPALTDRITTTIAEGRVREVTVAPGTTFEWMAFRRGSRARLVQPVRWDGARPFPAFEFEIDDLSETYTFVVPQDCGNLTLARREPSRERARLDAADAAKKAAEAQSLEEARRADDARKADEARRAEDTARAEAARKAGEARAAEVEAARAAEAARLAEVARQGAQAQLDEERALSLRPFVAGFAGKQRRQYDADDPAGLGTAFLPGFCDPLVGAKVGFEKVIAPRWVVAPAVGVAFNTDESERTSLFADIELNYKFTPGAYVGTGIGLWDVTHGDFLTPAVLLHAGVPVWTRADRQALFVVAEGRLFLDRASDLDSNYQIWGGLRWLFR